MTLISKKSLPIAAIIIGSAFAVSAGIIGQTNKENKKDILAECAQEPNLRFGYITCYNPSIDRLELKSAKDNALDLIVYTHGNEQISYLLTRGPNKNDLLHNPDYTHTNFDTITHDHPLPHKISAMVTGDINGDGLTDLIIGTYSGDVIAYQGISE
ncbi:hypothetical protein HN681_04160 [archaeon]|jgi:hypothetical protein|nr:hypothetical protein [archaeon]MBT3731424.1 hypothetical protein [archaeon]MBT4670273.1 hypothetical protein [archaeon]MBT5029709.1 hypothetical protein [archaeon]MBT5287542.1 hypothetical protein [archaeon]